MLPAAKALRTQPRPVPTTRRRESALGQDLTSTPQVRDISSTTVSGLVGVAAKSELRGLPSINDVEGLEAVIAMFKVALGRNPQYPRAHYRGNDLLRFASRND